MVNLFLVVWTIGKYTNRKKYHNGIFFYGKYNILHWVLVRTGSFSYNLINIIFERKKKFCVLSYIIALFPNLRKFSETRLSVRP